MSHPHLSHKIPWQELIFCCKTLHPSSLLLPVGVCQRIHIRDKATQIKVDNRKYIQQNDICEDENCETIGEQIFGKKSTGKVDLFPASRSKCQQVAVKSRIRHFTAKLMEAIVEFAETEEKKYYREKFVPDADVEERMQRDLKELAFYATGYCENDDKVMALFLKSDVKHLLYFADNQSINIPDAFGRTYGGQAVGCGYKFLMIYHMIPFYLISNAIIACGYQNDNTKWGRFSNKQRFASHILYDCDFLTFIPYLRPYLAEDVFMVDLEKTDELLKKCFEYICIYALLCKKYNHRNYDEFLREIQWNIATEFKFYDSFDLYS